MSEPLRVAAVVEGLTDKIVLQAILRAVLPADTDFGLDMLQPEGSVTFGTMGGGWGGVYRWSRQRVQEGGGSVSGSSALASHDLLIVHVDADVAGMTYASANIHDEPCEDLPCQQPCPPPEDTTNALRAVVLKWLGERECPPGVVLCTPSKNTEAWVLAAIWPRNEYVRRSNWECHAKPEDQLSRLPKGQRFKKSEDDYRLKEPELTNAWPTVSARLTEAKRFETEFLAAKALVFENP